jgi:predicted branched-subunit amino acid permease
MLHSTNHLTWALAVVAMAVKLTTEHPAKTLHFMIPATFMIPASSAYRKIEHRIGFSSLLAVVGG